MTASFRPRPPRRLTAGTTGLVAIVLMAGCVGPEEGGPPDLAAVTAHLDVSIGYIPPDCEPAGLDGNGLGTIVGAAFDCPAGTTVRIERFDAGLNDEPLAATPSQTEPGRIEWRDEQTGDVIRVASDDLDIEVLMQVAESIEVRR